jgi:hypothetical protein
MACSGGECVETSAKAPIVATLDAGEGPGSSSAKTTATAAPTPASPTFVPSQPPPQAIVDGGDCDMSIEALTCDELDYSDVSGDQDGGIPFGTGDLTLLVLFDRSGSMAGPWDLRGKWQAASDSMVAGMAPYLDNLTIGAILFPQVDACDVAPLDDPRQIDYVPGRRFVDEWVESACLNQSNGSTPLGQAFAEADVAIAQASELGLLDDRFRVMLVTDGEPNCDTDPDALVTQAARWFDLGVETWVIGLPGSEQAAELLDSIAQAGGTHQHAAAGNPCEFQEQVNAAAR